MSNRPQNSTEGFPLRFFSPAQVDEILRDGAKRGREGSCAAIKRILKFESALGRPALWRRLRQLKFGPRTGPFCRSVWTAEDDRILSQGYGNGWSGKRKAIRELLFRHPEWRPHTVWRRAARLHFVRKLAKRGEERSSCAWDQRDDQVLLNLAGYKTSRVIAKVLHRSEAAVRCRLMLFGKSSRVRRDGFSRHELATELHLGKQTVQRLIVEGLLQVRDPRITRESLGRLCKKNAGFDNWRCGRGPAAVSDRFHATPTAAPLNPGATAGTRTPSRAERVWADVANSIGVPLSTVQKLLVQRVLRFYDPTITDSSVRHFCKHHGSLINYDFLDSETQAWLRDSMGLNRKAGECTTARVDGFRKHAHVVRHCAYCDHAIRGNVFFRHVKKCRAKQAERAPSPHLQ